MRHAKHSDGLVFDVELGEWVRPRRQILLTQREIQLMVALCQGKSVHEVAIEHERSEKTVQTQYATLKRKLLFKREAQLGVYALANGFVDINGNEIDLKSKPRQRITATQCGADAEARLFK